MTAEPHAAEDVCEPGRFGSRVCFVIATYNEADNIALLLRRLSELYPDPDMLFLVVDDESPGRHRTSPSLRPPAVR